MTVWKATMLASPMIGGSEIRGSEHEGYDMKLRHLLFAAAMALTATQARADFSDNSIGAHYGLNFKEPGVASKSQPHGEDIHKLILGFTHFDVWKYGSNFLNVEALFSDGRDPANNSTDHGATEVYTVYRGQLSPDALFGLNTKFGPFDAINFEAGGDFNTKNTQFAPEKRLLVMGPNFHVAVPAGFLNIGVHVAHEWNYNGIVGKNVDFNTVPEFEAVWLFPLSFTGLPLDFRGFANLVMPKGKDGFGAKTVTEILARPQINLDLGKMLFGKPHVPDVYFAFEYWLNKFGNDNTKVPGSLAYTPMIGIEVHF
jgi:nucleoside-specific outer membrane channel protein Tsx